MGISCSAAVVPFCYRYIWEGDCSMLDEDFENLTTAELLAQIDAYAFDSDESNEQASIKDWVIQKETGSYGSGREKLITFVLVKDGSTKTVHIVNEAQYSNGGACEITACADSQEVLDEFMDDLGLPKKFFDTKAAVKQFL
jgi:hypothetical protein